MNRVSSTERTAKFSGGRPSGGANGVGSGLLKAASVPRPRRLAFWALQGFAWVNPPAADGQCGFLSLTENTETTEGA